MNQPSKNKQRAYQNALKWAHLHRTIGNKRRKQLNQLKEAIRIKLKTVVNKSRLANVIATNFVFGNASDDEKKLIEQVIPDVVRFATELITDGQTKNSQRASEEHGQETRATALARVLPDCHQLGYIRARGDQSGCADIPARTELADGAECSGSDDTRADVAT